MVVGGFGDYEDYEDWKLQSRTSSETTKMIMVLQRDNVSGTSLRSITVFERVDRNPLEGVRCTILLRQRQHQTPAVLETWYGLGAQAVGVASNIKRRERANDLALAYNVAIGTVEDSSQ